METIAPPRLWEPRQNQPNPRCHERGNKKSRPWRTFTRPFANVASGLVSAVAPAKAAANRYFESYLAAGALCWLTIRPKTSEGERTVP